MYNHDKVYASYNYNVAVYMYTLGFRARVSHTSVLNELKAILQVLIYKALYDKSYLGSKTTMTSGEWTCLISFATAPLTCSERGGSEKFKMKIYNFMSPAGFEPTPRQSKTGQLQRLRPLGHEGLMVISG